MRPHEAGSCEAPVAGTPPKESPNFGLLRRRLALGLALVAGVAVIAALMTLPHVLLTLFQHGIEFLLLISGEDGADLRIGVTAHLFELGSLVFARHRLVVHQRLHLLLLRSEDI